MRPLSVLQRPGKKTAKFSLWLVALLVVIVLATPPTVAWWIGLRWHNPGWHDGLQLGHVSWHTNGCVPLQADNVHLAVAWPLRIHIEHLTLHDCATNSSATQPIALRAAPAFHLTIEQLHYATAPALHVQASHRQTHWQITVNGTPGQLTGRYDEAGQRWQLSGHLSLAVLPVALTKALPQLDNIDLNGQMQFDANGHWRPEAKTADKRFSGQVAVHGQGIRVRDLPATGVTAQAEWQGPSWKLQAALAEPWAIQTDWHITHATVQADGQARDPHDIHLALGIDGTAAHAEIILRTAAQRLDRGHGEIRLSQGVDGDIRLHWQDGHLVIAPFTLQGSDDLTLALPDPVALPLLHAGTATPRLVLSHDDLHLATTDSRLAWNGLDIGWQGSVTLSGQWQDHDVTGHWSGRIDTDGVTGDPVHITLAGEDLTVQARLSPENSPLHGKPLSVHLNGSALDTNFHGTVTARPDDADWRGTIHLESRLPAATRGGKAVLRGRWQWQDDLQLTTGTLDIDQAVIDDSLLRPIHLNTRTPLEWTGDGLSGRLQLHADGAVTARWALPSVTGFVTLDGQRLDAALSIPDWQARARITGRDLLTLAHGTLSATLPLQPALTRGLDLVAQDGTLQFDGQWQYRNQPVINARLQIKQTDLSWGGSITAHDINADLALDWQPDAVRIHSRGPWTVARIDTGVSFIHLGGTLDSNLQRWTFKNLHADVLGGQVDADALTWPSRTWQTVRMTDIDAEQLAELQSKPVVHLQGLLQGAIPVRADRNGVAIKNGQLSNQTPLLLTISKTSGVQAMENTHQAVNIALQAINPLRINALQADLDMTDDGWLDARVHIRGNNPDNAQPVIFNYTHKENVLALLRSLRIGKHITHTLEQRFSNPSPPTREADE